MYAVLFFVFLLGPFLQKHRWKKFNNKACTLSRKTLYLELSEALFFLEGLEWMLLLNFVCHFFFFYCCELWPKINLTIGLERRQKSQEGDISKFRQIKPQTTVCSWLNCIRTGRASHVFLMGVNLSFKFQVVVEVWMIREVSEPTWRGRWHVPSGPSWRVHRWSWWSHHLATASPPMGHLHTSKEIIYDWISSGTDANMCLVIFVKASTLLGRVCWHIWSGGSVNKPRRPRAHAAYSFPLPATWNWICISSIVCLEFSSSLIIEIPNHCVCLCRHWSWQVIGAVSSSLAVIWQSSNTYRKITN